MIGMAAALGAIGIACILSRRTLLGVLLGVQLLFMGVSAVFVDSGLRAGLPGDGHLCALLVSLSSVIPLCGGAALAVRRYYLRQNVVMDDLRNLKR